MNLNQIINMVVRILMRKAIHKGVNAGIGAASDFSRRRSQPQDEQDVIAGQNQKPAGAKPNLSADQRQTKQAIRMARRAGRMNKL